MIKIFQSLISLAIKLVGPSNLLARVSYSQNYKTLISDKISCWEGEQFPLKHHRPQVSSLLMLRQLSFPVRVVIPWNSLPELCNFSTNCKHIQE